MTISSPTLAIPEPKWTFRRMAVFGGLIASLSLTAYIVVLLGRDQQAGALQLIAILLIAKQMTLYLIYLVAPSVEYVNSVAGLVKAVKQ